ncbi:MAG: hypothetical protein LKH33_10360 [Acetobacter sp.]|jgi:hypothetical protein|nr:hypothetical protein [Acetobacter sp.]MCH4060542.1 hypothetical protein [Acetobacter sp.]MCH4087482.1 hypothetical protein [Acetobacter sp.]MCI1294683.1 hypothetical protein [Acetobacter sp.]MCI1321168.1 hypothetical protein [Acetobacter sp.]
MQFSENQYPAFLRDGDVIKNAFCAVQARLKTAFPENVFRHFVVPPRASKSVWQRIISPDQSIALGWSGWKPDARHARVFRGDLVFQVYGIVRHQRPEDLYFGTSQLRGVGTMGLFTIMAGFLHGFQVKGAGTVLLSATDLPEGLADWIEEDCAIAAFTLTIPNVSLDDDRMRAQMDDFLRLSETWTVNGDEQTPAILSVRGD